MTSDPHRQSWSTVAGGSACRPIDLRLDLKQQSLEIHWQDGSQCRFDLGFLRRHCPCATCQRERRAPPQSLPILNIPPGMKRIEVVDAELVGHYALCLKWSDGHHSGIYDYRYLRDLSTDTGNTLESGPGGPGNVDGLAGT